MMATINGQKNPKPGKKAKGVLGTTFKEEQGKPTENFVEWTPAPIVPEGVLTANVNVSMGARIGLENYSDARCGASLTLPVEAKIDEIEQAFTFAKKWCEDHVQTMIGEIQEGNA
jgi:hypothetical protein